MGTEPKGVQKNKRTCGTLLAVQLIGQRPPSFYEAGSLAYLSGQGPRPDLLATVQYKEVACRICGNCQEWDRYPSLELPKVCPDCEFEGDFSARVFVTYALSDSALAEVVISELDRAQFRIKRSRITRTVGGSLDIDRLRAELNLCKTCVSL